MNYPEPGIAAEDTELSVLPGKDDEEAERLYQEWLLKNKPSIADIELSIL